MLSGPYYHHVSISGNLFPTSGVQITSFLKGPKEGYPTFGQAGARLQSLVYGDVTGTSENRGDRQRVHWPVHACVPWRREGELQGVRHQEEGWHLSLHGDHGIGCLLSV